MILQWGSLSISGSYKIQVSFLPLIDPESPSAKMFHFMLFRWIMIQIFIGESLPTCLCACSENKKNVMLKTAALVFPVYVCITVKKVVIVFRISKVQLNAFLLLKKCMWFLLSVNLVSFFYSPKLSIYYCQVLLVLLIHPLCTSLTQPEPGN